MEAQVVKAFIADSYGHLLRQNEQITGSELSERILTLCDTSEPRNYYAAEAAAEIGGVWKRKSNRIFWNEK